MCLGCIGDMTSISLYGAYARAEEDYAAPRFGHPKDRRPDLKQLQTGLAVTGDGGIPVFHRAYDGGAGEVSQVVPAMTALQNIAGPREFLLVGDSKLISYAKLRNMITAGVAFIAPASKTYVPARALATLDLDAAMDVDHTAERDAGKPVDQRGRWRVVEDTTTLARPRKSDQMLTLRRVFVHSTARAAAAVAARGKARTRPRRPRPSAPWTGITALPRSQGRGRADHRDRACSPRLRDLRSGLDHGSRHVGQALVVAARVAAKRGEGFVHAGPEAHRQHALRLLDDHPAVQRALELPEPDLVLAGVLQPRLWAAHRAAARPDRAVERPVDGQRGYGDVLLAVPE